MCMRIALKHVTINFPNSPERLIIKHENKSIASYNGVAFTCKMCPNPFYCHKNRLTVLR